MSDPLVLSYDFNVLPSGGHYRATLGARHPLPELVGQEVLLDGRDDGQWAQPGRITEAYSVIWVLVEPVGAYIPAPDDGD